MNQGNLVDTLNGTIIDFVLSGENRLLEAGTGSYSTPFRGTLFGENQSDAITAALKTRKAEVLWLGTNPNVSQSLAQIVASPQAKSDFADFLKQSESGFYSSRRWTGESSSSDWDPIGDPKGNWSVFNTVLASVARIDAVAMANYVPWGSSDFPAFVTTLSRLSPNLCHRILAFSDEILTAIVHELQPRLLVLPLGLARNALIRDLGLSVSLDRVQNRADHALDVGGRPFNLHTGMSPLSVPVVYLPHPSSLRLPREEKDRFIEQVSFLLMHPTSGSVERKGIGCVSGSTLAEPASAQRIAKANISGDTRIKVVTRDGRYGLILHQHGSSYWHPPNQRHDVRNGVDAHRTYNSASDEVHRVLSSFANSTVTAETLRRDYTACLNEIPQQFWHEAWLAKR